MPDILNATNPVPGYERNQVSSIPVAPEQIRNAVDTTRVTRADNRPEQQDSDGAQSDLRQIRYDSNFQTFLRNLQGTSSLAEALRGLLSERTAGVSETQGGVSAALSKLLQSLHMDQGELVQSLTEQLQNGSRFSGPLFSLLRTAYSRASSENLQTDILQFLKSYLNHASTDHIEASIQRELGRMADAMPERWAAKLRDMTSQLQTSMSTGDRQGSINLLRRSMIPLMSDYVNATHDMGLPRRLLSFLMLDLARYENGSEETMLDAFHQLTHYSALKGQLGTLDDKTLLQLLQKERPAEPFANQLAETASIALRGGANAETQELFEQLVSAMLLQESVYMPINHYLLPLEQDGQLQLAELWVDPDAENGKTGSGQSPIQKFLLQVQVPSMGSFDIVLAHQDHDVDIQVSCPEPAVPFSKQIGEALSQILTRNGLNAASIQVRKAERPLSLTTVFPKIFEEGDCVNVKV